MVVTSPYSQVVSVVQEFLGPAADRFIVRLIDFHLDKEPEDLTIKDIPKLIEWVKVSLGFLTEDKSMVDDCENKLLKLSKI